MKIEERTPESFSALTSEFQKHIDNNVTGSILCAIYHKGDLVYCNKFGWKDKENQIPIAFDDIFRMYSMTKPITCLAALILYELGKFDLDDPLEKYLPEFKNLKVLKSYDDKTGETELEEIENPITIKQLFTHTSGLSYGDYPEIPIDKLYGEKFGFTGENRLRTKLDMFPIMEPIEEFSKRLATLPLAFAPGKHWWYGFNHEILGFLIERLSEKKLDVFLKEHIFDKLGMDDTDFYVPEEKWLRLTKVYTKNQDDKLIEVEGAIYEGFKHKIQFLSGGGGLVSTLEDYLIFCLMMLNKGQYDGIQIISEETLDLMTSNHLPAKNGYLEMQLFRPKDPEIIKEKQGFGFGLGVKVKTAENMARGEIGEYGWGGAADTLFKIDPAEQVITIVLSQHIPLDSNWIQPILNDDIKISKLVYDALGIQKH